MEVLPERRGPMSKMRGRAEMAGSSKSTGGMLGLCVGGMRVVSTGGR
jgi:hypothetical protein